MTMSNEPQARVFKYTRPEMRTKKTFVKLARTDRMMAYVQVLSSGGENNLHSHGHLDGFWMVLRGRARFYGEGDKLLADLGPHEGILVPRSFKYWFESASAEPLELLQIEAADIPMPDDRQILEDRKDHSAQRVRIGSPDIAFVDGRVQADQNLPEPG
jgi:mannose-6-phosphate isomerase-like protein (cupin superfamily)